MTFKNRIEGLLKNLPDEILLDLAVNNFTRDSLFTCALVDIDFKANGLVSDYAEWSVFTFTDLSNLHNEPVHVKFIAQTSSYNDDEFDYWSFVLEITKPTFEEIN